MVAVVVVERESAVGASCARLATPRRSQAKFFRRDFSPHATKPLLNIHKYGPKTTQLQFHVRRAPIVTTTHWQDPPWTSGCAASDASLYPGMLV